MEPDKLRGRLEVNLAKIQERIADSARLAGRSPNEVRLIAVTKYVPANVARALASLGCADLGESRPQELWSKAESLSDALIRWHLIGHLQTNKVARTLPLVSMIHSVDSVRVASAIDAAASPQHRRVPILIEVNISGDVEKHGFLPADVPHALEALSPLKGIEIRGLMTMAARDGNLAVARKNFADLRELRDRCLANRPNGVSLDELSMGMSGDFEEAILEGSTLVRVGSALIEGIFS